MLVPYYLARMHWRREIRYFFLWLSCNVLFFAVPSLNVLVIRSVFLVTYIFIPVVTVAVEKSCAEDKGVYCVSDVLIIDWTIMHRL